MTFHDQQRIGLVQAVERRFNALGRNVISKKTPRLV